MPTFDLEMPDWAYSKHRDKLSVESRFAIYAIRHKLGISVVTLARAFKVSEATVYKITSMRRHTTGKELHSTYKYAHMEMKMIGLDEMYSRYVTDHMLREIATMSSPKRAGELYDAGHTKTVTPSPVHKAREGVHRFPTNPDDPDDTFCTLELVFSHGTPEVGPQGWYFCYVNRGPELRNTPLAMTDTGRPGKTSAELYNWCKKQHWIPDKAS